ncbi:hypothetical protein DGMP_19590 [Desulfomarina profundi]|uniref:Uncharacterized protein n=1 Tax=Desulfomarina profundi TaxID=2772557 RepID=A0A8D5JRP4_9BACT|nr:hypothetical protein [Desulfomarina profundi]BCL61266.1 hypothetical protein DGMP_19590 [Desulfomarina profundi]
MGNMSQDLIKIAGINGRFTHSCLALFYVRNVLEQKCPDFSSQILQFTINDNYYEMLLRLTVDNPRYIFFSAVIWNSTLIERLVIDLNHSLPDCSIVIGGRRQQCLVINCLETTVQLFLGKLKRWKTNFSGICFQVPREIATGLLFPSKKR